MLSLSSQEFAFKMPKESQMKPPFNLAFVQDRSQSSQISQLVGVMTQFIKNQKQMSKGSSRGEELMEARDRVVLIDLPEGSGKLEQEELENFVTELCKKVWSMAFNAFSKDELTFQNTKIFASEQILRNLVRLGEKFQLGTKEFKTINEHIQTKILSYMWHKYPMTLSQQIHRNLNRVVKQVNNLEQPENNYLNKISQQLKLRENGSYNDFIMKSINSVLKRTNAKVKNSSVYQKFQSRISQIFELVLDSDYMEEKEKEDREKLKSIQNFQEFQDFSLSMTINNLVHRKQTFQDRHKDSFLHSISNKTKFREKVQAYTEYKIGRKLPDSTRYYSQEQIAAHNFTIQSPQVLRFISKWCQQLQKKFEDFSYFDSLMDQIRLKNKGISDIGSRQMSECLKQQLKEQKFRINIEMEELFQNNNMLQSDLMKKQLYMNGCSSIERYELIAAKYSLDIVNNLHSYTIKYLNRLIHGLLRATAFFRKRYSNLEIDLSIISLQVSDLFRCKCTSGEKEVIRIYNQIIKQCQNKESNFSLVRVVNRLQRGTNDILVNLKYRNVLCEVQLAVKNKKSNFIQFSNTFNHYFYQIKRSLFGPLTQLCSIWKCLDSRFGLYQKVETKTMAPQKVIHEGACTFHQQFENYFKPFICNICLNHFYDNIFIKNHQKCKSCQYWICAKCQIKRSDCLDILNAAFKKDVVAKCKKITEKEDVPEFGICVKIHCSDIMIEPFKKIIEQCSIKIMGVNKKKPYEIIDVTSRGDLLKFKQNYLIFKIDKEYGKRHIKLDQSQLKQIIAQQKLRNVYIKNSDKICINQQKLSDNQISAVCSFGSTRQRQNISQIQLIGNNLESVDSLISLFPNVVTLNLSDNKLKYFKAIKQLVKLENLTIDSNGIEVLPDEVLFLRDLKEISAAKNRIREVPKGVGELKELRSLCLNRNKIGELPKEIGKLQLVNLNLSDNQIRNIQDQICSMKSLQVFQCQNNKLSCINDKIQGLSRLKSMNLSHNQIDSFPFQLTQLSTLSKLDLSFNKIKEVPSTINQLSRLEELNVSHNELNNEEGRQFPDIALFSQLQSLDLSHNCLSVSPKFLEKPHMNIAALERQERRLKILNLSSNKIKKIDSFHHLQNLQKLYLNSNELQTLHDSINQLNNIKILHLQINKIKELPCLSLKLLQKLILNRNFISTFHNHSFKDLQTLQIADNSLTQFEDNYIPKLQKINLSNNNIKQLQLCQYLKVKTVMASNNKLTQFPLLNQRNKPRTLILDFNQIAVFPQNCKLFSSVSQLNLAHNQLGLVPNRIRKMKSLDHRSLELSNNPIQSIECWEFLEEKATPASLKYLETCKKKVTVLELERETVAETLSRGSRGDLNAEEDI